ncbi:MAG: glycosyltransferase family 2 protein [Ignavibacteriae bacterium]|nr:glycosyltransferase family 2 protein [Ignavibacteriota bacterium]
MSEKISATLIVKNEEKNIARCLKSLSWVDEIVVVDSYSTDRTVEICNEYNCKVIQTAWLGFGKTKKFAVDNASHDWILSIDADEEVTPELQKKIKELLVKPYYKGYYIKRKSFYLGKEVKHCGWNKDYPVRLFNRNFGNFNDKEVHESIKIKSEKSKIHEPLLHYTYQTIASHIEKVNRYSSLAAEELIKKEKYYSVFSAVIFGIVRFIKMYFIQLGFLDGRIGFILCYNSAFSVYLKYVKTCQIKK